LRRPCRGRRECSPERRAGQAVRTPFLLPGTKPLIPGLPAVRDAMFGKLATARRESRHAASAARHGTALICRSCGLDSGQMRHIYALIGDMAAGAGGSPAALLLGSRTTRMQE